MLFLTIIAVIYLFVANSRLKTRVSALEAQARAQQDLTPDSQLAEPIVDPQISDADTSVPTIARSKPKPAAAVASSASTSSTPAQPMENTSGKAEIPTVHLMPGEPKRAQGAVVFTPEKLKALTAWVAQNWFYLVSAASLALAGIFFVIYGMEQGLLPPAVRVMISLVFGAGLIGAGEFIRRRYGDTENSAAAYLPSTFSGAGIVTLFGSILSARLLYDFIGPEVALLGMAAVGGVAMILGWFYGPLLAAVGVIGAMIAPFIIGGASDDPSFLLLYFAIVTLVGLAIDTLRRWAWVSVIALTLGFGTGLMLTIGAPDLTEPYFILYCLGLAVAAIAIPVRKLIPDHDGAPISMPVFVASARGEWPEFPTRLAAGAVIAACGLSTLTVFESIGRADVFWTAFYAFAALTLALLVWARNAPALIDLAVFPAVSLVAVLAAGAPIWQPLALAALEPEAPMPMMATTVLAIGLFLSACAAWRSLRGGPAQLFTALGAAVLAPSMAIALEVFWQPAHALGSTVWALHAMALAAAMVVMAERFSRVDGDKDRNRASFAVLSALACITFGMVLLFSEAALTTAISLTIVAAAWLDRKFNLPLMGIYVFAGVLAVGYRLVVDPGADWAVDAPLPKVLLSHGGAVVAFALSYLIAKAASRPRSMILLESAVFSSLAILMSVLLFRAIEAMVGSSGTASHWAAGLGAIVWLALGAAQLRRLELGGKLAWVRKALGSLFILIGGLQIFAALTLFSPLIGFFSNDVSGPRVFNTLIPAYLLPALLLIAMAWWLKGLPTLARRAFAGVGIVLSGIWLAMTIRHFWQGSAGMDSSYVSQPELYSYTVAMLVIGAGLFYQSLAAQNAMLRKAGLVVIGLTVAKVFFVDISGLGGLIRVFSLLFLGLALAGLAWLNRWASDRDQHGAEPTPDTAEDPPE